MISNGGVCYSRSPYIVITPTTWFYSVVSVGEFKVVNNNRIQYANKANNEYPSQFFKTNIILYTRRINTINYILQLHN